MKKILLTLTLAAGVVSFSHAQGIKVGLKGGINLANTVGDDAKDSGLKVGALAGIALNLGINDMISIQPEVLYSVKGDQEDDRDFKLNLSYIDVPVLLRVDAEGLFFEVGPQLGILASAKAKDKNNSRYLKDSYKTVDFGYVAGVGYQIDGGFNFGLRYNGGITNAPKEFVFLGTRSQAKIRNSAFQFYVGYMFGGK